MKVNISKYKNGVVEFVVLKKIRIRFFLFLSGRTINDLKGTENLTAFYGKQFMAQLKNYYKGIMNIDILLMTF